MSSNLLLRKQVAQDLLQDLILAFLIHFPSINPNAGGILEQSPFPLCPYFILVSPASQVAQW